MLWWMLNNNLFMKIFFILDSFCNILFWCTRLGAVGRISCITRITRSWCRSSRNCSLILIWISILGIRVGLRCAYSSLKSTYYIKSRNCKYRLKCLIASFYTEKICCDFTFCLICASMASASLCFPTDL